MAVKNVMNYMVEVRNIHTNKIRVAIEADTNQACWASLALRHLSEDDRVYNMEWHYEVGDGKTRSTPEEVRDMVEHFFQEDQRYGMGIEFLGKSPLEGKGTDREIVRFSNMTDYPRNLFMAKMFIIRNLNRYTESYFMYRKLIKAGVPVHFAAAMGATVHEYKSFDGKGYCMRGYASTIAPILHTIADWRNSATNNHLGQLGYAWGDPAPEARGGYNYNYFDGVCRGLKRLGYTNSPTVATFIKDTLKARTDKMSWKNVMDIAAYLTGKGYLSDKEEPVLD